PITVPVSTDDKAAPLVVILRIRWFSPAEPSETVVYRLVPSKAIARPLQQAGPGKLVTTVPGVTVEVLVVSGLGLETLPLNTSTPFSVRAASVQAESISTSASMLSAILMSSPVPPSWPSSGRSASPTSFLTLAASEHGSGTGGPIGG